MAIDLSTIDVVMSTVAVVIGAPDEPPVLDQDLLTPLLGRPFSISGGLTVGPGGIGNTVIVTSPRQQIEVIAQPTKINVQDQSGKKEFEDSKITDVLYAIVDSYGTDVASYGLNFVLSIECPEPSEWIARHVYDPRLSARTGKTLLGGSANIRLDSPPVVLTLSLNAEGDNHIHVNSNASYQGALPDETSLRDQLTSQYADLKRLLSNIGSD